MVVLLGLALAALPRAADVGRPLLVHVPVHQAAEAEDLPIVVGSTDFDDMGMVELYYRRVGEQTWSSLGFERRDDGDYQATIPADEVLPPGVEYYIAATEGLAKGDRFASAGSPQVISVEGEFWSSRARRDLERFGGHTSELSIRYEYAGWGSDDSYDDQWHRTDVHLDYRLLHLVRQLRLGASVMRADSILEEYSRTEEAVLQYSNPGLGLDYGYAAIELAPHDLVGVWGEIRLGATENGFSSGGAGGLRLGLDPGTHMLFWAGSMGGYGSHGGMTLHWATVPRVPMQVELEATNWPDESLTGVRLSYEARIHLGEHAEIRPRVGYQARFHELGGPLAGAGLVWHW